MYILCGVTISGNLAAATALGLITKVENSDEKHQLRRKKGRSRKMEKEKKGYEEDRKDKEDK